MATSASKWYWDLDEEIQAQLAKEALQILEVNRQVLHIAMQQFDDYKGPDKREQRRRAVNEFLMLMAENAGVSADLVRAGAHRNREKERARHRAEAKRTGREIKSPNPILAPLSELTPMKDGSEARDVGVSGVNGGMGVYAGTGMHPSQYQPFAAYPPHGPPPPQPTYAAASPLPPATPVPPPHVPARRGISQPAVEPSHTAPPPHAAPPPPPRPTTSSSGKAKTTHDHAPPTPSKDKAVPASPPNASKDKPIPASAPQPSPPAKPASPPAPAPAAAAKPPRPASPKYKNKSASQPPPHPASPCRCPTCTVPSPWVCNVPSHQALPRDSALFGAQSMRGDVGVIHDPDDSDRPLSPFSDGVCLCPRAKPFAAYTANNPTNSPAKEKDKVKGAMKLKG